MDFFQRKGSSLHCEEVPLQELAIQFGTPLYVYSYRTLERHLKVFQDAFASVRHLICFSVKANGNLAVLSAVKQLGGGADVVSGGELFRSTEAGIASNRIVFSGVGKTLPEIEYAIRRKILMISVESEHELHQIASMAEKMEQTARVSFRLNPDVDPKTHPYISTGLRENKFGLPRDATLKLYKMAKEHPHVEPVGLSFHIGSQLTDINPVVESVKISVDLIRELRRQDINIQYIDCGGGLGVQYVDEKPPSPKDYADAILPHLEGLDLTVVLEPGRSVMGNAGVLLTKVLQVKKSGDKAFVIADAGMSDLIRPSLYRAEHKIELVGRDSGNEIVADLVGPICESGDFLAKDRKMVEPMEGDLVCVRTAGAYGFVLASQYNARPRAAEVMVKDDTVSLIRKRETFDDLVRNEEVPDWLKEGA